MKNYLYRTAQIASLVWLACVSGTIVIIAVATKFMTHDADFSPGDPEHIYLLPMLSFFFIGSLAFATMALALVISFFKKGKVSVKPVLGLPIKQVVLLFGVLAFGTFSFLFGWRQASVAQIGVDATYTGQDVFNAVNTYRTSKNLKTVALESHICDNLVQRYLDLTNPDNRYKGHIGFEQWVNKEGLKDFYSDLAENYVKDTKTPEDAIKFWVSSPGHRLTLEGNYDVGCAYAHDGTAVMVFGKKN